MATSATTEEIMQSAQTHAWTEHKYISQIQLPGTTGETGLYYIKDAEAREVIETIQSALIFVGVTEETEEYFLPGGAGYSSTAITVGGKSVSAENGDIIIPSGSSKEFIWVQTLGQWSEFGDMSNIGEMGKVDSGHTLAYTATTTVLGTTLEDTIKLNIVSANTAYLEDVSLSGDVTASVDGIVSTFNSQDIKGTLSGKQTISLQYKDVTIDGLVDNIVVTPTSGKVTATGTNDIILDKDIEGTITIPSLNGATEGFTPSGSIGVDAYTPSGNITTNDNKIIKSVLTSTGNYTPSGTIENTKIDVTITTDSDNFVQSVAFSGSTTNNNVLGTATVASGTETLSFGLATLDAVTANTKNYVVGASAAFTTAPQFIGTPDLITVESTASAITGFEESAFTFEGTSETITAHFTGISIESLAVTTESANATHALTYTHTIDADAIKTETDSDVVTEVAVTATTTSQTIQVAKESQSWDIEASAFNWEGDDKVIEVLQSGSTNVSVEKTLDLVKTSKDIDIVKSVVLEANNLTFETGLGEITVVPTPKA